MRVVLAVHHFPPHHMAGAEQQAYRTACRLRERGHEVQVICVEDIVSGPADGVSFRDDTYEGLAVRRLSFNLAAAPDPFRWSYDNPWIGQHLREFLPALAPDVVHLVSGYLMSGSALQAATDLGLCTVVTLTDFWFLCPRINLVRSDGSLCPGAEDPVACALCLRKERRRYRLPDQWSGGLAGRTLMDLSRRSNDQLVQAVVQRRAFLLAHLQRARAIISPSRFLKEMFEAQGVHHPRFHYVRQGLDLDRWTAAEPVSRTAGLRIGYIGQVAHHKGVDVLVEAFLRLRSAEGQEPPQLLIYGDPKQFPEFADRLRQRVADRRDIVFAGRFDHAQIRRIHAGLDLLVVPSVWYENSPTVILEAFACGTPVVVTGLGGMAELVADGVNGLRFHLGDPLDLARVLRRFIDQPGLIATLRKGIPLVRTDHEETEELLAIYQQTCEAQRKSDI